MAEQAALGRFEPIEFGQRVDARQGLAGWLVSFAGDVTAVPGGPRLKRNGAADMLMGLSVGSGL